MDLVPQTKARQAGKKMKKLLLIFSFSFIFFSCARQEKILKVEEKVVEVFLIEGIQDNTTVSGQFFIGSGQISECWVYTFYKKEVDTSFSLVQLPAEECKIKWVEPQGMPRVIKKQKVTTVKVKDWPFSKTYEYTEDSYVILVPKGTIKNDYVLDTKK